MDFMYDVFLSYRHRPMDNEITQKTFNLLESYKLPKSLQKQGFYGVSRAFRDTEELAVSRILSATIEEALRSTKCLVVVCSPDTPSSEWVDREVATFIELGRSDMIFPLLIAGDEDISFPPSLKTVPDIARRVMDVRDSANDTKKIMKNAQTELLRVIAAVAGCSRRELLREHKLRNTRKALAKRGGSAAIFLLVLAVSAMLWLLAERYRETARSEQETSMAMLQLLTYELPSKLVELPGTYRTVSAILEENAGQIIRILEMAENDDEVSREIAANYEKLATARLTLGEYTSAVESQRMALEIYERFYSAGDDSFLAPLASGYNNIGSSLLTASDYEGATAAFEKAIELGEALLLTDSSYEAQYNQALYLGNLGSAMYSAGDFISAAQQLEECCESLLALRSDGDAVLLGTLARNARNLSNCYSNTGRYSESEKWLVLATEAADELFELIPNRTNLANVIDMTISLATLYTTSARFEEAITLYDRAVETQQQLAVDEENVDAQTTLCVLYNNYGMCLNMTGDYEGAGEWYEKNAELRTLLHEKLQTPLSQATAARAYYNVAENAFKLGDYPLTKESLETCLAMYEPVSEELGSYHRSEHLSRLAYYEITCGGDLTSALISAAEAVDLQPESSFAMYNFAYALLYNGLYDACDQVLLTLAERGEGEYTNVKLDFEALTKAGLYDAHMDTALLLMEAALTD